jgi:hypothetical protein
MIRRNLAFASVALCIAGALSGCTAAAEPASTDSPQGSVSEADRETCAAFSEVLTITSNADVALAEQRMAYQEKVGWYRVATHVLELVPTSGEGDVSDALAVLKELSPLIGSDEWNTSLQVLSDACTEAGSELTISMFSGG